MTLMTHQNKRFHLLTALIILAFALAGILTIDDYGMGWDEVTRWKSGDLKLEYYQNLISGESDNIAARNAGDRYPGLFDLPLATVNAVFGGNRFIQGHLLSLAFAILGLVATAWLATLAFGARTACFSILLLILLPHFYGHAMINPKDIPFMATYTLGLAAVLGIARSLAGGRIVPWHRYLMCGLAVGTAAATRIPGMVLLAIAAGSWTVAALRGEQFKMEISRLTRIALRLLFGLFLAGLAALGVVLLFFPRAHFQLFSSIPAVAGQLHSSAKAIPLVFNGEVMTAGEGVFAYAHRFFLISTPLWMLALMLTGLAFLLRSFGTARTQGSTHDPVISALFLAMAAFPWVYILFTQPALHNGVRHMLFGIPPLAVLMGYGVHQIFCLLKGMDPWKSQAAAGAAVFLVVFQAVSLYRMHPYQYVSFNFLAGDRSTIPNRYEAEYWFTSSRHLLAALPAVSAADRESISSGPPIPVRISGPLDAARPFVPKGFILVDSFEEARYYVSNTTMRADILAEGEVVHEINRGGIPIGVIKRLKQGP